MESASSPWEKKTCLGCKWTTFRPTPASSRKTARLKVMHHLRRYNGPSRMQFLREQFGSLRGHFRLEMAGGQLVYPTVHAQLCMPNCACPTVHAQLCMPNCA